MRELLDCIRERRHLYHLSLRDCGITDGMMLGAFLEDSRLSLRTLLLDSEISCLAFPHPVQHSLTLRLCMQIITCKTRLLSTWLSRCKSIGRCREFRCEVSECHFPSQSHPLMVTVPARPLRRECNAMAVQNVAWGFKRAPCCIKFWYPTRFCAHWTSVVSFRVVMCEEEGPLPWSVPTLVCLTWTHSLCGRKPPDR